MGLWQNREIKYPYKWTSSTIAHILQKHEYLGHSVNFKTRKHFKDKKSHYVDEDREKGIYFHAGVPNIPRASRRQYKMFYLEKAMTVTVIVFFHTLIIVEKKLYSLGQGKSYYNMIQSERPTINGRKQNLMELCMRLW